MSSGKVSQVQKEALNYSFWQMRTQKCQDHLLEYQMLVLGKFSIWHTFSSTSGLRFVGQIPPRSLWLIISVSWIWSGKLNQSSPVGAKPTVVRGGSLLRTATWDAEGCVFLRWKEQHTPSSGKSDFPSWQTTGVDVPPTRRNFALIQGDFELENVKAIFQEPLQSDFLK